MLVLGLAILSGAVISTILLLVMMEGLLSADNALVLSNFARKMKDPEERKKVLYYGMVGAIAFRALFIGLGTFVLKLWILKVVAAIYLLKMVFDHFKGEDTADDNDNAVIDKYENTWFHKVIGLFGIKLSPFWAVVVSIEFMDLAFSVDSITASLAVSNSFWILFIGGVLGIAMMRGVARLFTSLIEKVPEMEHTAYVLIAIIGIKMLLGTVHSIVGLFGHIIEPIEIPDLWFFGLLVVTFAGTFLVHAFRKKSTVA